jgi:hypothetical protein
MFIRKEKQQPRGGGDRRSKQKERLQQKRKGGQAKGSVKLLPEEIPEDDATAWKEKNGEAVDMEVGVNTPAK